MIGHRAMFCLFPRDGKAFFVSTNTDGENSRHSRIDERLATALDLRPVAETLARPEQAAENVRLDRPLHSVA